MAKVKAKKTHKKIEKKDYLMDFDITNIVINDAGSEDEALEKAIEALMADGRIKITKLGKPIWIPKKGKENAKESKNNAK